MRPFVHVALALGVALPVAVHAQNVSAGVPAAVSPAPAPDPSATPEQVIERLHATIIEAMKNADRLGFEGRAALLGPVLRETFDFDFMGSKAVGRHWKSLTQDEQHRWLAQFAQLIISNYAGRFNAYGGEAFETIGEDDAARDTRVVLTKLHVPSADDVQMNYRMRKTSTGWRVIDIYLNGTVSELALRRSEYSSTLKREGFDKLAAAVDAKIADLRNKGDS